MFCPACFEEATPDGTWLVPAGLDPVMKRYVCEHCKTVFFVVPKAFHRVESKNRPLEQESGSLSSPGLKLD